MKNKLFAFALLFIVISFQPNVFAEGIVDYTVNGNNFVNQKKYAEAIEQYQQALKKNPEDHRLNLLIGLCYAQLGKLDEALRYTELASKNAPSFNSYYNLGLIYSARQESDKAIQEFDRALAVNPKSFLTEYQKGLAYGNLKKYNQAIPCYQKALALNPSFHDARIALVGAFLNLGDQSSAKTQIEVFRKMNQKSIAQALEARMKKSF